MTVGPDRQLILLVGGRAAGTVFSGRHWRRLAEAGGLNPDRTITRIRDLAARTPDALSTAVGAEPVRALDSDLPARLLDRVSTRARHCQQALDR